MKIPMPLQLMAAAVIAIVIAVVFGPEANAHHSPEWRCRNAQTVLTKHGYVLDVDADCSDERSQRAITHWQTANGLTVDGIVGPQTLRSLGLAGTSQAERFPQVQTSAPPPPTGPVGLSGCDLMRWHRINVGLPEVFDRIVYRESRCRADPSVRTFCCHGPLQLYVSLHLRDHRLGDGYRECGVNGVSDINGPEDLYRHYCAAKVLYDVMGTDPWRATR